MNYAVHDFDIMADVLGHPLPEEVTATALHCLGRPFEDLAIVACRYPGGAMGYTQVSWLTPKKVREFWLVGERRSAAIDTMNLELEVYDAGITPQYDDFGTFRLITRQGEVRRPPVEKAEPLRLELAHFIECARTHKEPVASGEVGLNAVRVAEAALESARKKRTVRL
jgi:predicted dehydrogenase